MRETEQHIHEVINKYLNHALPVGALHFAVDSAQMSRSLGRKLKARGGKRGIPDHHILCKGFVPIFFEIKTRFGELSVEQVFVADLIRANGGLWFMVRSAFEVEEALRLIGVPLRASFVRPPPAVKPKPRAARKPKRDPRYALNRTQVGRLARAGIRT